MEIKIYNFKKLGYPDIELHKTEISRYRTS